MEQLANMFGLHFDSGMQDWPYEVADPAKAEHYLRVLTTQNLPPDISFTLLDMVLESVEESDLDLANSTAGDNLAEYITKNFDLHAYQVWYWAALEQTPADAFRISPFLQRIWSTANASR
tara:strand:+ start:63 stop:422 length:360 start_codon:yes stop_codon:yes gene_type:complete